MTNEITIVGSINVDNILHIAKLPQPGETISMSAFSKAAGGKGANQAVAAVRSGAATHFVGRVGDDDNGKFMLQQLASNHIDVSGVLTATNQQTGQAYILLQASGQNSIIVQHGANFDLTAKDVDLAKAQIEASDFTIAQFETPVDATIEAFKLAHAAKRRTILNPAPAQKVLPDALLALTDLITPNETESEALTGIHIEGEQSLKASAAYFHQLGVAGVVITLGEQGSYVSCNGLTEIVPAFKVNAVDTTAAGDTFIGAMASQLTPALTNLDESIRYASKASSLTVQKLGAFPSIPTQAAVLGKE